MSVEKDLFDAIAAGDCGRLSGLLQRTPALAAARNDAGIAAPLYALYHGRRDLLEVLLAAGQPLDVFEATAVGRPKRVRELLADNPSLTSAFTADGFTALHFAGFFRDDVESARMLLDAGADADAIARNPMKVTPLHSALAGPGTQVARLLVERGANANARQEDGFTPLAEAAQNGDESMVDYLLAHGARGDIRFEDGRTAASIAEAAGHTSIAARLRAPSGQGRPGRHIGIYPL